ncbi:MAG: glycoside hydrolase family 140 protein [Microscillaceae bacterium]|nr:glycoside hydrolase family 140 protein [Microscillaceae bacterium]
MRKLISLLLLLSLSIPLKAQFSISENQRFILRDGKPFFWLADTAWELFHRLNREQADQYLKRRAEQGFTVIQAVALAEFDGLHVPNPYGDLPLDNDDPAKPIDKYFQHVDYIIDKAAEYGLVIGFLPTWGDKLFKNNWGKGPEVFTPANAEIYGRWLGNRYKNRKNIIWILGGDRNPRHEADVAVWRAMAKGVEEGVGGGDKALISFHPQPHEEGSAQWFHTDKWLDFNMFQNGHCRDKDVYAYISRAYQRTPIKPVMDAEPIYEDHPVCFNAKDLGTSNAYDVRKAAYLDLFAGAFGHTYGCHDIWQFYSPHREAVNNPHIYWQEAMELPGANQMKFVRRLLESRPYLDRVPDQTLIEENDLYPADRIQATRGKDYLWVYSSTGRPFTVNLAKISGNSLQANWYNPRNGEVRFVEKLENISKKKFTPPSSGYGQDWILILDDASKNYTIPDK